MSRLDRRKMSTGRRGSVLTNPSGQLRKHRRRCRMRRDQLAQRWTFRSSVHRETDERAFNRHATDNLRKVSGTSANECFQYSLGLDCIVTDSSDKRMTDTCIHCILKWLCRGSRPRAPYRDTALLAKDRHAAACADNCGAKWSTARVIGCRMYCERAGPHRRRANPSTLEHIGRAVSLAVGRVAWTHTFAF